jgi:hypothetical protein
MRVGYRQLLAIPELAENPVKEHHDENKAGK